MKTVQECTISGSQSQETNITSSGFTWMGGVNQKQNMSVDLRCMMSANKKNQMAQDIANAIKQAADAQGSALGGLLNTTSAGVSTTLTNNVKTSVNMDSIQKSMAAASQSQKVNIRNNGGVFLMGNVTQDQGLSIVLQAISDNVLQNTQMQKVQTALDQDAKAKQKGLFDFDFGNITMMVFILLIIVLVVAGLAYSRRAPAAAVPPSATR